MEPQLAVHPQEGIVDGFLRDRAYGAVGGASQMPSAAPGTSASPGHPSVDGEAADPAAHFPGQRVDRVRAFGLFFLHLPQGLGLVIHLLADDGRVGPLHIELVHLAPVDLLDEGEAGLVGFLAEGVAHIFLI